MQNLFSLSFRNDLTPKKLADIIPVLPEIDTKITKSAPEWPLSKVARIDLSILRLAVWEMTVEKKEPPKVIIDEAVELAKEYGNDHSPQFINGVLGAILKQEMEVT